jgi:2-iminoacetate synthase ThiH
VSPATRLSEADALELYRDVSIHDLGHMAFQRLQELHPEDYRTYVVDRNINYANVCTASCTFCNFYRRPGHSEAYILSFEEIGRKIEELLAIGGTQILMQGGLVPAPTHPPARDCRSPGTSTCSASSRATTRRFTFTPSARPRSGPSTRSSRCR